MLIPGILLFCGALLWIFSFRNLLNPVNGLINDALPYYQHIKFYLDSMGQGVYPLWDPLRDFGTVNEFYLRRIGELNPLYWFIAFLHKGGVPFLFAYKIFLAAYYFLGMAGFYFLCRRLFSTILASVTAVLLLMFSSLGGELFESYILLIGVPSIWFSFFLVAFIQDIEKPSGQGPGARVFLLGMVFCLMVILCTYLPFYFMISAAAAFLAFVLVYGKTFLHKLRACLRFTAGNKILTFVCVALVVVGLLPALLWRHQSSHGQALITHRHSNFSSANIPAIEIGMANHGGISTPLLIDQTFFDLDQRRLGDFYIPLFAFLVIACGAWTGITRRMVFLVLWAGLVYWIGVADAGSAHKFLFDRVFFFKYFRNLHFLQWLTLLPIFILLVAEIFSALLRSLPAQGPARKWWMAYIIAVHAAALAFFMGQGDENIISSSITIALSAVFFLCLTLRPGAAALVLLAFAAIVAQPFQVYAHMNSFYHKVPNHSLYEGPYDQFGLPGDSDPSRLPKNTTWEAVIEGHAPLDINWYRSLGLPYLCSQWFHDLFKNVDFDVLSKYVIPRLLIYDRTQPLDTQQPDYKRVEQALQLFENTAFVSGAQAEWSNGRSVDQKMRIVTPDSPQVKVIIFNANQLRLHTRFDQEKFLVYNNNYHVDWRAYCDGKPITILRANVAFQGVYVPAGEHIIDFHFGPPWRFWVAHSLIAVYALTLGCVVWLAFRRRKS